MASGKFIHLTYDPAVGRFVEVRLGGKVLKGVAEAVFSSTTGYAVVDGQGLNLVREDPSPSPEDRALAAENKQATADIAAYLAGRTGLGFLPGASRP